MHVGGRVNALDWDNVGTITHLHDTHRSRNRPVHDQRRQTHPNPTPCRGPTSSRSTIPNPPTSANERRPLPRRDRRDDRPPRRRMEHRTRRPRHRTRRTRTSSQRRSNTAPDNSPTSSEPHHHLGSTPGSATGPTDPAGTVVYDDEIRALAVWRDTQQLDPTTPGYGPAPTGTALADEWRAHMDRALDARHLARRTPAITDTRDVDPDRAASSTTTPPRTRRTVRHRPSRPAQDHRLPPPQQAHHRGEGRGPPRSRTPARKRDATGSSNTGPTSSNTTNSPRSPTKPTPSTTGPNHSRFGAQAALDELRATMVDTPEDATISEIEAAIDQQRPPPRTPPTSPTNEHRSNANSSRSAPLSTTPTCLRRSSSNTSPDSTRRLDDLDHADRTHRDRRHHVGLGPTASTPILAGALARRSNHLAYTAVANKEPWIETLVREAARFRQPIDAGLLHNAIIEVAAYRDRADVDSDQPLGQPPSDPRQAVDYERLAAAFERPISGPVVDQSLQR